MATLGGTDLVTIPRKLYDALLESIDVLAAPEDLKSLTRAFRDVEKGRMLTLEELDRRVARLP